jgi:hypothetical protein
MKRRLMRMLLLAMVGFIGREIRRRLLLKGGGGEPHAHPTAAPFDAHVQGDSVHYEATNPSERDPKDPNEPFGGTPTRSA